MLASIIILICVTIFLTIHPGKLQFYMLLTQTVQMKMLPLHECILRHMLLILLSVELHQMRY